MGGPQAYKNGIRGSLESAHLVMRRGWADAGDDDVVGCLYQDLEVGRGIVE